MKTLTLRYFEVNYTGLTSAASLVVRLEGKLKSSALNRLMPVNKVDSNKSDLISDFLGANAGRKIVAGTMLRIVNSRDVPIITEAMLQENQFTVSSINEKAGEDEKTCLDYFYFALSDEKLIVTLDSRSGISRFETYINWLLNTKDSGEVISITPSVDLTGLSLSDLSKITINNAYGVSAAEESGKGEGSDDVKSKIVNVAGDVLKKLFADTASLKELMDANICSADLVIKFSKPRTMDEEEYKKRTAGAILKPMEDPDSITFKAKNKKIKGGQILKTEIISVDCDESNGAISEQDVYQQMIKRLK